MEKKKTLHKIYTGIKETKHNHSMLLLVSSKLPMEEYKRNNKDTTAYLITVIIVILQ